MIKRVKISRRQNPERTELGRPLLDPAECAWCDSCGRAAKIDDLEMSKGERLICASCRSSQKEWVCQHIPSLGIDIRDVDEVEPIGNVACEYRNAACYAYCQKCGAKKPEITFNGYTLQVKVELESKTDFVYVQGEKPVEEPEESARTIGEVLSEDLKANEKYYQGQKLRVTPQLTQKS